MAEQPNQRRWNDSVSDLPIFHGNDKDTITAESIVARVEAAANTLTWDDEQTYNNFSLAMRSNAEKWLTLQSDIRGADFRKSWQYIKPLFREAFGSKMDESKVFLTLKDLGQKHSELVRDFAIRFNDQYRSIKELMRPRPINVPAAEADRTVAVCQGLYAQGYADAQMEFQRILFISSLEMPLLTKVVQKEVPTFVQAMDVAAKIQQITKGENRQNGQIHRIQEECLETSDAEFVNQIQHGYQNNRGNSRGNSRGRSNSRGNFRGNGNRGNSRGNYSNSNSSRSNSSSNNTNSESSKPAPQKVKCMFCLFVGHHQDDCRKRINAGKPCISAAGKEYFPRNKVHQVNEDDQDMGQSGQAETQSAVNEKSEYLFQ